MPPTASEARPRRFAKACDACHKSKVRCNRLPDRMSDGCANCIRRNLVCTSTIAVRRLAIPKRSLQQLDDTAEGCPEFEAHTTGSNTDRYLRRDIRRQEKQSDVVLMHDRVDEAMLHEVAQKARPHHSQSDQENEVIDLYFETLNHTFPILDRDGSLGRHLLQRYLVPPEDEMMIHKTAKLAVFALATQSLEAGSCHSAAYAGATAKTYLDAALEHLGHLMMADPSLPCIQTLLLLALALSNCPNRDVQASSLLAVASRQSQILNLHQLDYAENLSMPERLSGIRLFWCLYSLEQSIALQLSQLPLIIQTELFVIEPQERSADGLGLISSVDGMLTLNLFTARQRLAKVQAEILGRFHTFQGRHSSNVQRQQNFNALNASLLEWEARWFARGQALERVESWDSWMLFHIVKLHFDFFLSLLASTLKVPVGLEALRSGLAELHQPKHLGFISAARVQTLPVKVLLTLRTMIKAIKVIIGGNLKILMQYARFILPAILVLVQGVIFDPSAELAKEDLEDTRNWISKFQQASEKYEFEVLGGGVRVAAGVDAVTKAWEIASRKLRSV